MLLALPDKEPQTSVVESKVVTASPNELNAQWTETNDDVITAGSRQTIMSYRERYEFLQSRTYAKNDF